VLCPPSLRGFEIAKSAAALSRLARRFPAGLGPFDVLYL